MLFVVRWAFFLFHIRMCWLKGNKNWLILESVSEKSLRKHNEEHVVNMDILMKVVKGYMPGMKRGMWVPSKVVKNLEVSVWSIFFFFSFFLLWAGQ